MDLVSQLRMSPRANSANSCSVCVDTSLLDCAVHVLILAAIIYLVRTNAITYGIFFAAPLCTLHELEVDPTEKLTHGRCDVLLEQRQHYTNLA